jgi:hypothetical protein
MTGNLETQVSKADMPIHEAEAFYWLACQALIRLLCFVDEVCSLLTTLKVERTRFIAFKVGRQDSK